MTSAKFKHRVFHSHAGCVCQRKYWRDQTPSHAHSKCYFAVSFQGVLVPGAGPCTVQSFWICIHAGSSFDVFVCLSFSWTLWFTPGYTFVHLHIVALLGRLPNPSVRSKVKLGGRVDISKSLLGQRTRAGWAATSCCVQRFFIEASGLCVFGKAETDRGQRSSLVSASKEIIGTVATYLP